AMEIVERWRQLTPGQITGCTKNDDGSGGRHRLHWLQERPAPQERQQGGHVAIQLEADDTPPGLAQRLSVAQRLGHFERAEGYGRLVGAWFIRNGQVAQRRSDKLDEEAVAAISLVQLSRGVQETGAVANGHSNTALIAQVVSEGL